jgi:hypothetical protein
VWYSGVAEVAKRFPPRLVIVSAGAAKPRGPFHVTMDNNDAIETAHAFPQARMKERLQTMDPGDTVSLQL